MPSMPSYQTILFELIRLLDVSDGVCLSESNSAAILLADSQLKGGDDLFQQAEVMNGFRIFKKDLI